MIVSWFHYYDHLCVAGSSDSVYHKRKAQYRAEKTDRNAYDIDINYHFNPLNFLC